MNDLEFLRQLPCFHLRFDFAAELGFLDHVRQPLTTEAAAAYCRRVLRQVFSFAEVAAINAQRRQYPLPRFFMYLGAVAPTAKDVHPWITDGPSWFRTEDQGLFSDMVGRARVALGGPPGQLTLIYPLVPAAPVDQWILPDLVVLHDTRQSVATVIALPSAKHYLTHNRQTT